MTLPSYRVTALPHYSTSDEVDGTLAAKYRNYNLGALQASPEAFATSYEHEKQFGIDRTKTRLSNPRAKHFIAIQNPQSGRFNDLGSDDTDWLGMIVLLAPHAGTQVSAKDSPWATMNPSATGGSPEEVVKSDGATDFHLNAVFVSPSARRSGLGKQLIVAALSDAEDRASRAGARTLNVSILVDDRNHSAKELYERCGFVVIGSEHYVPLPRTAEKDGEVQVERTAIKLERTVPVHKD